ncbi:MAG: sugar-binding protein [Gammaproteobacteria bacterium]|nr:sugar-binding protein [Gammaproteobacteria bacterium]
MHNRKISLLSASCLLMLMGVSTAASATQGTFQNFLDTMRAFESGIDPAKADFYRQNLDLPVYTYAQVTAPGEIVRDPVTGSMIPEATTIREFFSKLGVNQLYSEYPQDEAAMFRSMQYNSLNAWGFIGYQLGEAVMISAGYYSPKQVQLGNELLDSFYIFMPDSTWANGVKQARSEIPGSGGNYILATDTNLWLGEFVGKNGVNSLNDLRQPDKQEVVIRDVMRFNYGVMTELLTKANMTWGQALAKSWPGKDEQGNNITIPATMSGLLAAAHLRGAWGTADLLINNNITCDELGTCITTYIHKFGGYPTIFDTPANDLISGSPYNETLTAGWGDDVVETGGGKDVIQLHESAGGNTLIKSFTVGDDRILLRGWTNTNPLSNLVVTQGATGATLNFASQTLVLENVTAASILANPSTVIASGNIYPLAWSGKSTVSNFNPLADQIRGTAGIDFKHLKAFQENGNLFIGTQAADGGIYSWIELTSVNRSQLNPEMFVDITGSYQRLGFTVMVNYQNWGWGQAKVIDYFNAADTVINLSAFPYTFSQLKLSQDGSTTVLSLHGAGAQGDTKTIRLLNTEVSSLSAANFFGLKGGSFSDVTIDDPANAIYHDVTISVSGSGGTVSPSGVQQVRENTNLVLVITPDSGFVIKDILVNGVAQPVSANFSLTQVQANASVVVSFEQGTSTGCSLPVWQAGAVYVGGNKVQYQGFEYTAKWWTQNETPGTAGVWTLGAACQ